MWDLIVSVPDHCLSFYLGLPIVFKRSFFAYGRRNSSIGWSAYRVFLAPVAVHIRRNSRNYSFA